MITLLKTNILNDISQRFKKNFGKVLTKLKMIIIIDYVRCYGPVAQLDRAHAF